MNESRKQQVPLLSSFSIAQAPNSPVEVLVFQSREFSNIFYRMAL